MPSIRIIGAGSIGNHLAHAARSRGWSVVLTDIDPAALARARDDIYPSRYGAWDPEIVLRDTRDAFADKADVVFIGTPPDTHVGLALATLEQVTPRILLIEKPLAGPDLADCQTLAEVATRRGVHALVGYNHRLGANTRSTEEILRSGRLGTVVTISARIREHWAGIFKAHRWLSGPAASYLGYSARGGGACGEHSHGINIWQHFAEIAGAGRVAEVSAMLDMVREGDAAYDRACYLSLKTTEGLVGDVIQDVVTLPVEKSARIQGSKGFVEWRVNYRPDCDAVLSGDSGGPTEEKLINKTRADDFKAEIDHLADMLAGNVASSPISLERGLDTMMVIAAAFQIPRGTPCRAHRLVERPRSGSDQVKASRVVMVTSFRFEDLFIYDLANNHQGDVAHASAIVSEMGRVTREAGARAALKFQFRQLDTFIHPDFQHRTDLKYVKRFTETKLSMDDFANLAAKAKQAGMLTMSTPFDEESVDIICEMGLDVIKVASASADDRPLLEKIAQVNKPVVVSTAGLRSDEIDWLVNFLDTERVDFALMHCVALYPTPNDKLQLNQIRYLKERYPEIPIGWSTHESPDSLSPVQLAYSLGARLFERHVGINTSAYKLNAYSSTPDQVAAWLSAFRAAKAMIGAAERPPAPLEETMTLKDLKRGVFATRAIAAGETIGRADVFFAIPMQDEQMISGLFRPGMVADRDYGAREALRETIGTQEANDQQLIYQIMLQVRGILNSAGVHINEDASIEISHHYGLRRFREYGAVIITCINRDYAKKLVIQLPRQKHPYHFHKQKEETFQLLAGDLEIVKDGERFAMRPGDTLLVEPNQWHKFHTLDGCIFEEISTTHHNSDSFYEDPAIARLDRTQRKTGVDTWLTYFRARHNL